MDLPDAILYAGAMAIGELSSFCHANLRRIAADWTDSRLRGSATAQHCGSHSMRGAEGEGGKKQEKKEKSIKHTPTGGTDGQRRCSLQPMLPVRVKDRRLASDFHSKHVCANLFGRQCHLDISAFVIFKKAALVQYCSCFLLSLSQIWRIVPDYRTRSRHFAMSALTSRTPNCSRSASSANKPFETVPSHIPSRVHEAAST